MTAGGAQEKNPIEELRSILGKPPSAEESAKTLPRAIRIAREQDQEFATEFKSVTESILYELIRTRPKVFAEIIFPVILPAIRRAILEAIQSMVDEVERILDKTFTLTALKWRLESWKTGRPYSEIAVLRSANYSVQDIFLIHRSTGLLLLHVASEKGHEVEAESFAPLLISIQEALRESLRSIDESDIRRLEIGPTTVWIEPGPLALLVVRVEGPLPRGFRAALGSTLGQIHGEGAQDLLNFSGDSSKFRRFRPALEACLHYQQEPAVGTSKRWIAAVILLLPIIAVSVLAGHLAFRRHTENRLLEELQRIPGVTALSIQTVSGRRVLKGLCDPSIASARKQIEQVTQREGSLAFHFTPYLSLDPRIVVVRAQSLLGAPSTVTLNYQDGTLVLKGTASKRWIDTVRSSFLQVPGVSKLNDRHLTSLENLEMEAIRSEIHIQSIYFSEGSSRLSPSSKATLDYIQNELIKLKRIANSIDRTLHIRVEGNSDFTTGSRARNIQLKQLRAKAVMHYLHKLGPNLRISQKTPKLSERAFPALNRRVFLTVLIE